MGSRELPRYGIKHGLANWTAAYATGLLVARRALKKLGLDEKYQGQEDPDGELVHTEPLGDDEPRPFKCYLDVGLKRTSTGSRVFGAMKGASDGGIFIPHNARRFPGYDVESKELDAEVLRNYIYGGHIAEFMESLEEEDDERFKKHFSSYLNDDIGSEDIDFKPTEKSKDWAAKSKKFRQPKLTYEQRKERVQKKVAAFQDAFNLDDE